MFVFSPSAGAYVSNVEETLNVGRSNFCSLSIDALKSKSKTFDTEVPLNASTINPFLNLGKFAESRILKSCLVAVSNSSNDNEV